MSGAHNKDLIFRAVNTYPTMLRALMSAMRTHQRNDEPARDGTTPAALIRCSSRNARSVSPRGNRGFGAVAHAQHSKTSEQMDFDGALRDTKLAGDALVRRTVAERPQHV